MNETRVFIDLSADEIDVSLVRSHVLGDPALGGVCTFEGATRDDADPDHGPVVRLEYEAYEAMARRQMATLADKALHRWGPGRVAMVHRIGQVPVGDVSVMIAVACGHRAEAFAACRWLIDTLKRDVPIWKRDVYADGFVRWVDPTAGRSGREA